MKKFYQESACKYGKYVFAALVSVVVFSALFWIITVALLHSLSSVVAYFTENDTILRAVENLSNVTVRPPLWWTTIVGLLLYGGYFLIRRAWRREPRRRLQAVLWGVGCLIFLLLAFIISFWMTKVNGIPVHTMVTVLWKYIVSGALNEL